MGLKPQQRMVKWGRMRSQHGVFKKCLADLIAFQYALHSFSDGAPLVQSWQTPAMRMLLIPHFSALNSDLI